MNLRRANKDDAAFLAKVILIAGRAHQGKGWFDVALGMPEPECLKFIEDVVQATACSWWHHSHFLIAELDATPAAALCCFRGSDAYALSLAAITEAAAKRNWSDADLSQMSQRGSYIFSCTMNARDDAWTLENVAALPEYRRHGLVSALIEAAKAQGRAKGFSHIQVTTLIGNTPAINAYLKAGFELVEEKLSKEFASAAGAPGLCRFEAQL